MKRNIFLLLCFLFSIVHAVAYAQKINVNWQNNLNKELEQFKACKNTATAGISTCNKYIGSTLYTVYNINDFYSKELGRHMLVSEVSQYLKGNKQWSLLGHGYEQKALVEAQEKANAGRAVVAVYLNEEGIGHVSVILPGEMKPSGTWGIKVPNSASFFLTEPEKSYINKSLSYAYERPMLKGVLLYVRNY